jgi:hypothetical protein
MDIMTNKIGTVVTNHGDALAAELGLKNVRHTGNYHFEGKYGSVTAKISTEPVGADEEQIRITSIAVDPEARQTIGIVYHMRTGNRVAETYAEIEINSHNYEKIKDYDPRDPDAKARPITWINDILKCYTKLQGFDTLDGICTINLVTD